MWLLFLFRDLKEMKESKGFQGKKGQRFVVLAINF